MFGRGRPWCAALYTGVGLPRVVRRAFAIACAAKTVPSPGCRSAAFSAVAAECGCPSLNRARLAGVFLPHATVRALSTHGQTVSASSAPSSSVSADAEPQQVCFIDLETSGLHPTSGRIVEIGVVRAPLCGSPELAFFETLVESGTMLSRDFIAFTGITPAMVAQQGITPRRALEEFLRFVGNTPLVAHNAPFDRRFLEAELSALNIPFQPRIICTVSLARRLFPGLSSYRLGPLLEALALTAQPLTLHRAAADVRALARLWTRLYAEVQERLGRAPTLAQMEQLSLLPANAVSDFLRRAVSEA